MSAIGYGFGMRSPRLLAILMELTRVPRTTVAALAERYGVTSRTIQRDVAALHDMGVPVWTRTGPAGGVGLVDGWRSPITGMTAAELQALIIGEAGARGLGLHVDFETARLKMLTTSAAQTEIVEPAQERFLLDNERWFSEPEQSAALPDVARAVWSGRRLTIRYQRPGREEQLRGEQVPRQRLLDPLGLVLKTDAWYLVAAHRRSPRTYRLSRIVSAVVHENPAWRPAGFSLAEYWKASRAAFEASVYSLPVRLSIPVSSLDALRSAAPGVDVDAAVTSAAGASASESSASESSASESSATEPSAVVGPGRLELELLMESLEIAAAQLLTVDGVAVHEPDDLRRRLFERGQDLAARHRAGASLPV